MASFLTSNDVDNDDHQPAAQQGPPAWRAPPFSAQSSLLHCLPPGTLFIIMITMMLNADDSNDDITDVKMVMMNFDDVRVKKNEHLQPCRGEC